MFFNIKTVREGIILLTYFREYNDAHHFACAEHPDLKQIKHRIDSVFSEFEDGLKKRRTHSKYIRRLNENLTNEADILWAKKKSASQYFFMDVAGLYFRTMQWAKHAFPFRDITESN